MGQAVLGADASLCALPLRLRLPQPHIRRPRLPADGPNPAPAPRCAGSARSWPAAVATPGAATSETKSLLATPSGGVCAQAAGRRKDLAAGLSTGPGDARPALHVARPAWPGTARKVAWSRPRGWSKSPASWPHGQIGEPERRDSCSGSAGWSQSGLAGHGRDLSLA